MYVPVIHARQSERLAIRKIADKIQSARNGYPLVIPVKDDPNQPGKGLRSAAKLIGDFSAIGMPFALLVTPYAQNVQATQAQLLQALEKHDTAKLATPVIAVASGKAVSTVESEIKLLPPGSFSILHVSPSPNPGKLIDVLKHYTDRIQAHYFYRDGCDDTYWDRWKDAFRVLIEDGFSRQDRNADYRDEPDEEYSNLAFRYSRDGFQGYGDHTICGEPYVPGGGPAQTVAIHLTYPAPLGTNAYSQIRVRHFLSRRNAKLVGPATAYFEALEQLVAFYRSNCHDLSFSRACGEFEGNLGPPRHFPQLAAVKRMSIQHHIELMLHLNL